MYGGEPGLERGEVDGLPLVLEVLVPGEKCLVLIQTLEDNDLLSPECPGIDFELQ